MSEPTHSLRILYAAGPGDVMRTYRNWVAGHDDPSEVAMTSSGMFYDLCRATGDTGYVIATHRRREFLQDRQFIIEHRPTPFENRAGALFHLGQLWAGLHLVVSAVRFRADVVVAVEGSTHWFVLGLLAWFEIAVIPDIHCVLWPKFGSRGGQSKLVWRLINAANRRFFQRQAHILTMSHDIADQIRELTGRHIPELVGFLPTYRAAQFGSITPPVATAPPFRVLFVGRIEANKGVFDLLAAARRCPDVFFDLCGAGSALDDLRRDSADLYDRFRCHGHCDRDTMREMYSRSHVVVVPTRTEFVEGFNQVVAEAVLAGRPVITSAVCPALAYVRGAAIEVAPNDIAAYVAAIQQLAGDASLYAAKHQACREARSQFLDLSNAWNTKLAAVLQPLRRSEPSRVVAAAVSSV
jgi:glycosyltransferase involved in cell wall biosynthesis